MNLLLKNVRGFTLIEIVLTVVLVGVLAGVAAAIIMQGARSYTTEQSRGEAHQQARFALDRMAREIRLIRSRTIADIPTMNDTTLRYVDTNGSGVGFRWNVGGAIDRTQDGGATWQTLASGITTFDFNYYQSDGVTAAAATNLWFVEITMTATQGAESLALRTTVHPRNF